MWPHYRHVLIYINEAMRSCSRKMTDPDSLMHPCLVCMRRSYAGGGSQQQGRAYEKLGLASPAVWRISIPAPVAASKPGCAFGLREQGMPAGVRVHTCAALQLSESRMHLSELPASTVLRTRYWGIAHDVAVSGPKWPHAMLLMANTPPAP